MLGAMCLCLVSGCDNLITKLTDRISNASSLKLILAHMPLIMVCIEVSLSR